jgi:hypothetical protein
MMRSLYRFFTVSVLAGTALLCAGENAVSATKTSSKGFGVYVVVGSSATIALNGYTTLNGQPTFIWNGVKSSMQSYALAQSGDPVTVTGGIRTSPSGGAASIVVMSPANIIGTNKVNNTLAINEFALTCSGAGNSGTPPAYAPALTKLKASSSTPCATWGAGATTRLNFSFALYLQTQNSPQDTYQSTAFSIVATAT